MLFWKVKSRKTTLFQENLARCVTIILYGDVGLQCSAVTFLLENIDIKIFQNGSFFYSTSLLFKVQSFCDQRSDY